MTSFFIPKKNIAMNFYKNYKFYFRIKNLQIFFHFIEFPPFQKHILQHEICQTVEIIARNDSEPYVRASAFRVLTSMIKIRMFWENVLHELDVKVRENHPGINFNLFLF